MARTESGGVGQERGAGPRDPALSPTDAMPLTTWAKILVMVQSLASLLTVALVFPRAVDILS